MARDVIIIKIITIMDIIKVIRDSMEDKTTFLKTSLPFKRSLFHFHNLNFHKLIFINLYQLQVSD